VGRFQECYDICQKLLAKKLPPAIEEAVRRNMAFAKQRLDEQAKVAVPSTPEVQPSPMKEVLTSPARILFERCPLCDHPDIAVHKQGDCSKHTCYHPAILPVMTWMQCGRCKHVFTDGYFTEEALGRIFARTLDKQVIGFEMESQRWISARMIEKVLPYQSSGKWLDIGVGNGSLLYTAEEYGFSVVGIDLRKSTVEGLQRQGYEAYCQDFQELEMDASFNVISMADVLEHMPYPRQALQHVHRLLADGGVVLISMPNSENAVWRLLDEQNSNPYWGELEHYHSFSRSRLCSLLTETGFETLRYGISERYRVCMEIIAAKSRKAKSAKAPTTKTRKAADGPRR
jgi:SAM-dependent methyltransferase